MGSGLNKNGVAVNFYHDHDVLHSALQIYTKTSRLIRVECSIKFDNLYIHIPLFPTTEVRLVDRSERDRVEPPGAKILALPHYVPRRRLIVLWVVPLDVLHIIKREPHKISGSTFREPSHCGRIAKAGVHPVYYLLD